MKIFNNLNPDGMDCRISSKSCGTSKIRPDDLKKYCKIFYDYDIQLLPNCDYADSRLRKLYIIPHYACENTIITALKSWTSSHNTRETHAIPISGCFWKTQADRFVKGCLGVSACVSHLECLSSLSAGYMTRRVQLHLALRFPDHVTLRAEQRQISLVL